MDSEAVRGCTLRDVANGGSTLPGQVLEPSETGGPDDAAWHIYRDQCRALHKMLEEWQERLKSVQEKFNKHQESYEAHLPGAAPAEACALAAPPSGASGPSLGGPYHKQNSWRFPEASSPQSISEAWVDSPKYVVNRADTQRSTIGLPELWLTAFSPRSEANDADPAPPPRPSQTRRLSQTSLLSFKTGVSSVLGALEGVRHRSRLEEIREARVSRSGLRWLIRSAAFRTVISAVILLNAVCIGLQVDHSMLLLEQHRRDDEMSSAWIWIELGFCIFFTSELLIRILADRMAFLIGADWRWNAFDSWLVVSSIVSLVVELASNQVPSFAFARLLRLFRFTRVLRILRAMRFSHSLRLMLYSILSTGMSLFWVFFLLLFVLYFFTIFFMNSIVDHFDNRYDDALFAEVKEYYSSVEGTLLSLFMCITGGVDWREVVLPLERLSDWYVAVFVLYVFFMVFGVLNVVVAAFVDAAYQVSQNDREAVTKAQLKQERGYMSRLKTIFHEADQDSNGTLSWEEFEAYLADPEVAAFFHSLDLDVTIAKELFVLLDTDDTNSVGIDEFVGGCARLKGAARNIDVNMLLYESRNMISKLNDTLETVCDRVGGLEKAVARR